MTKTIAGSLGSWLRLWVRRCDQGGLENCCQLLTPCLERGGKLAGSPELGEESAPGSDRFPRVQLRYPQQHTLCPLLSGPPPRQPLRELGMSLLKTKTPPLPRTETPALLLCLPRKIPAVGMCVWVNAYGVQPGRGMERLRALCALSCCRLPPLRFSAGSFAK